MTRLSKKSTDSGGSPKILQSIALILMGALVGRVSNNGSIMQTAIYYKKAASSSIIVQPQSEATNHPITENASTAITEHSSSVCQPGIVYRKPGFPALDVRRGLGAALQQKGFERGVEVGVQYGRHSMFLLKDWPSCQYFGLVDLWAHQENYIDAANVGNRKHDARFRQTMKTLKEWENKTQVFRMLSTQAALKIPDTSLDFVYIDARHDYCGCTEDMEAYYPKLRPGGILAGHDFMYNAEVKKATPDQDFSVCMNGTRIEGAVRGAVEEFASAHDLMIGVTFREAGFNTWWIQKPTRPECVK